MVDLTAYSGNTLVAQHGLCNQDQPAMADLEGTSFKMFKMLKHLKLKVTVFIKYIQEFWSSTSIAGLSNSASAATPQRRLAWLIVLGTMMGM